MGSVPPVRAPVKVLARLGLAGWIELLVVAGCCVAVFVWLGPGNIFTNTTPTGGDMGAHVWGPAFLRDELLPNWQIRGWSTDWYAGFPVLQFYMVLPYLVIVAVDVLLPYGVAFKLVAISGVVLLPAAGWAMARLARWPRPVPELCAVAMLLFGFQVNYTIYGGNIASTLAGEFAFAMGLCVALVYFGLLLRSLETGVGRARAAVALAIVTLLHPITAAFAVAITVIAIAVWALHRLPEVLGRANAALAITAAVMLQIAVWNATDSPTLRLAALAVVVIALLLFELRRAWWALTIGLVGGAISAFWSYPFFARRSFLNDMGWVKITEVRTSLFFPNEATGDAVRHSITWLLVLAAVAVIVGLLRWQRTTLLLLAIATTMGMAFTHWPQHRFWNARILPFWYLSIYLLAAVGVWVLVKAFASSLTSPSNNSTDDSTGLSTRITVTKWARLASPLLAWLAALGFVALYLGILPWQRYTDGEFRWGPLTVDESDRNFVQGWASWNFTGYEQRSGYPTYSSLIEAVSQLGEDHGCGSLLWEYEADELGSYGTPMAPMLLPYWTDGCIASMEGLYFESSPTVPFHFLMQSELSQSPSRAMRGLPYSGLDFELGVAHMQMSGVRYYAAFSTEALKAAERSGALKPVAYADPWVVYAVTDSEVVQSLDYEPAVVIDAPEAGRFWTDPAVIWFNDRSSWDVLIAADGPADWERVELLPPPIDAASNASTGSGTSQDISASFTRFATLPPQSRQELPDVTVSEVVRSGDELSFRVDRTGVPVLVKVSYFPNWSAQGALGPYRVTPNWMVVVPTDEVVQMRFGATGVEYTAWALTLLGVIALAYFALRPPARFDTSVFRRTANRSLRRSQDLSQGLLSDRMSHMPYSTPNRPSVSVVLPAFEAAEQVANAVAKVRAYFADRSKTDPSKTDPAEITVVEIIVVDDGSSDDTAANAMAAGADRVIIFASNKGKGAAVRAGMLAATGDIRIFTDVDLSYPPQQLSNLIEKLNLGVDVAVGNRRHAESIRLNSGSRLRTVGSRLFNLAARLVLLGNYRDTQCGLKGFTAEASDLIFNCSFVDGFAFDVEVLYLAEVSQLQVVDVPVVINHEADSTVRLVPQVFSMLSAVMGIRRRVAKGEYRALMTANNQQAASPVELINSTEAN